MIKYVVLGMMLGVCGYIIFKIILEVIFDGKENFK